LPRLGARALLPRVSGITGVAILVDASLALATGYYLMPRGNLILWGFIASIGITLNRRMLRQLLISVHGEPRVLLAGKYEDILLASRHLETPETEIKLVGECTNILTLAESVQNANATHVLLMSPGGLEAIYPQILGELESNGIGVFQRIGASDTLMGLKRSRQIAGMPFTAIQTHTLTNAKARFKRLIELTYLLIAFLPILFLACLVGVYVRFTAGRNIIYQQKRIGKYGTSFVMLKFRTMPIDAEKNTGVVKAEIGDNRIIPKLEWVRKTRLDEIPQFLNVLKGEMSIIGPRPERPDLTAKYEMEIPGYGRRHDLPPGITGLAQVKGRYHTDPSYKLGHDLQYLVNWSPILDIQIIFQTIWIVLARRL
jgi:lipopolysaccharide/colanic/teichoic acid biosynthesis glycosyltransferase